MTEFSYLDCGRKCKYRLSISQRQMNSQSISTVGLRLKKSLMRSTQIQPLALMEAKTNWTRKESAS